MMKRIMIPGASAVALAASALLAPEAEAQGRRGGGGDPFSESSDRDLRGGRFDERGFRDGRLRLETAPFKPGFAFGGYRFAQYGRGYRSGFGKRYDSRYLGKKALEECRCEVEEAAYKIGFRDVDFEGFKIEQIGPFGFHIVYAAEFEGRRRDFDSYVSCTVRKGKVVDIDGIPRPGRRHKGFAHHTGRGYAPFKSNGITVSFAKSW